MGAIFAGFEGAVVDSGGDQGIDGRAPENPIIVFVTEGLGADGGFSLVSMNVVNLC